MSVGSKPFNLAWLFNARTKPWCWSIYPSSVHKIASALDVEPSELVKAS